MTILKEQTIKELTELLNASPITVLEGKFLWQSEMKRNEEEKNGKLIFELDDEENETIVFSNKSYLTVDTYLETDIANYKKVFDVLEILEKNENVSNLNISMHYSNNEELSFQGESTKPTYDTLHNMYNLAKNKMIQIAKRTTSSKLVYASNKMFMISDKNQFLKVDISEAEHLLKNLGFLYTVDFFSQKVQFVLEFDSKDIYFSIYENGTYGINLNHEAAKIINKLPSEEELLEIIMELLFK